MKLKKTILLFLSLILIPIHIKPVTTHAAVTTKELSTDIVTIVNLLESLVEAQYLHHYDTLMQTAGANHWNLAVTEEQFFQQNSICNTIDYYELIASLCIVLTETDVHLPDITLINMDIKEEYFPWTMPLKVNNYSSLGNGTYSLSGTKYLTESGTYPVYEANNDGSYILAGEEYIELEKEKIPYGSSTLTNCHYDDILLQAGLVPAEFKERYVALYQKLESCNYTADELLQSLVYTFYTNPEELDEEMKGTIKEALDTTTGNRHNIISTALSLLGAVPYQWGGKPSMAGYDTSWWLFNTEMQQRGLDCSGYVQWVYMTAGYPAEIYENLLSTSTILSTQQVIPKSMLLPGDLGILHDGTNGTVNHTGIYLGNDYWIHCNATDNTVSISRQNFTIYMRVSAVDETILTNTSEISLTPYLYTAEELNYLTYYISTVAENKGFNTWVRLSENVCKEAAANNRTIEDELFSLSSDGISTYPCMSTYQETNINMDLKKVVQMVLDGRIKL